VLVNWHRLRNRVACRAIQRYAARFPDVGQSVVMMNFTAKGPPDTDGMAEIAYGVSPEYQCKGYATEAAAALVLAGA
jgi:ribosomal-protein-alanine N-acetyltransferase